MNQQAKSITVETAVRYLTFLPKSYSDHGEPVPLLLFLHGSGERGDDLNKVKAWGPPAIAEKDAAFPFMLVSPQAPEGESWTAHLLKAMLDELLATYNVDHKRIYLTGMSMGGFGTWDLAMRHPEYFAAIAPVCGGGSPQLIDNLKDIPTWVFHGQKDDAVPEQESANMVAALEAAGGNVKYTMLPEAGHSGSWEYAYDPKNGLFDWLLSQKKA